MRPSNEGIGGLKLLREAAERDNQNLLAAHLHRIARWDDPVGTAHLLGAKVAGLAAQRQQA